MPCTCRLLFTIAKPSSRTMLLPPELQVPWTAACCVSPISSPQHSKEVRLHAGDDLAREFASASTAGTKPRILEGPQHLRLRLHDGHVHACPRRPEHKGPVTTRSTAVKSGTEPLVDAARHGGSLIYVVARTVHLSRIDWHACDDRRDSLVQQRHQGRTLQRQGGWHQRAGSAFASGSLLRR